MYTAPKGMKNIPPQWLTYWVVEDCDKVVSKAQNLGAGVIKPGTSIPEMGRFAILTDPQGGAFAVMHFDE